MKRIQIGDDNIVSNVSIIVDEAPATTGVYFDVDDDFYVGPLMLWNGDTANPEFS